MHKTVIALAIADWLLRRPCGFDVTTTVWSTTASGSQRRQRAA